MPGRVIIGLLAALFVTAVACGTDDGAPARFPADETAAAPATPSPTPTASQGSRPAILPTSTTSPFDDFETHPLTRINGGFPDRPGRTPTAIPGQVFEYERRLDAFPIEGQRPYLKIDWNVPLIVADESQQALIKLMAKIPDTPENRVQLQLSNQALWSSLTGFNMPAFDDGKDAYQTELSRFFEQASAGNVFELSPGPGPHLSGYSGYGSQMPTFDALGIDQRNVDQSAVAVPSGVDITEIIAGRYDPGLSWRRLAECDCPQPLAVTSYEGFEYWTWSDGPAGELQRRHAEPVFDHVGRGGHILMTDDGLYRTLSVPLMELLIDTLNGAHPSLADAADFLFIADVMGASNAVSVLVADGTFLAQEEVLSDRTGFLFEDRRSDGSTVRVTHESTRANALLAPLLLPYETIATASGVSGQRRFEVAVLVHENESAAEANALRLADRLVFSNSIDGLPWALTFPFVEITVSGKYLVARLYGTDDAPNLGLPIGNLLLAHE